MKKQFKSGFVALIGRPNVGKSTLLNRVLGSKISITADKPQTTRDRILGIYDDDEAQAVFLDTPGIHQSDKLLNQYMQAAALAGLADADLVIMLVEAGDTPQQLELVLELLADCAKPVILVLNKADKLSAEQIDAKLDDIVDLRDFAAVFSISALKGAGVDELLGFIKQSLPEGPRYFDPEELTDLSMRFLTQELIREKVFRLTRQEVPYAVAVVVEEFRENEEPIHITACIHVEKDSQKGIVIGRGGSMLKKIGIEARRDIERLVGNRVFLELFVRVTKDWTKNPRIMKELGYN